MPIKTRYLTLVLFISPLLNAAEPAPFSGVDFQTGENISLRDYSGKVIFLDFWASWCPPCIESLPAWESMRKNIGTDQFELIAVNVDENPEDGEEFLDRFSLSYPILFDPEGEIGIPYGIRSLPTSYLIDSNGQIVEEFRSFNTGDEIQIQSTIEALLQK
jgi:cytochrome c biogenesis protein CcmG/thiol:disulfide interchange protein DsbE